MIVGIVVATAAAAAAATAMLQPAAVVVVDLQRTHDAGIEGVGESPLSRQISPAGPAADASALASLAIDAAGAAVPPVDGAASVAASDDTAPADDTRAPTAPLIDAAEGSVPLVAGSAADISANATATADDAGAPPTDVAEGTVPPVARAVVSATVASEEAGALADPRPTQWGKQYRRSPALLQVPPLVPRPLTTRALPPHPSTTQRGRHQCRSPLQPQVLLQQVSLPSAPTAAVPPTGRTSASPYCPTEATPQEGRQDGVRKLPRHHARVTRG